MNNVKNVLITGGSGLIGKRLTEQLKERGFQVSHLGRSGKAVGSVRTFKWDIDDRSIEKAALQDVGTIIHLAGAGVNDKRWNDQRKKEILKSRTESTRLLKETLSKISHGVKNFISASGIGYYGFAGPEKVFEESDPPGDDFLAKVTSAWEDEAETLTTLGLRVVKIRIGVVLSAEGGALKALAQPIRLNAGAPLGSGAQFLSWIHIDDLCRIFIRAIEDESMRGVYNAVAPTPVTNKEMTQAIAATLHKPLLLPPIPGFVIRMAVGGVAEIVLNGSVVSSKKIERTGFSFQYKALSDALQDLLK
jgi:uncharacterized protein (TIGR01777 family)